MSRLKTMFILAIMAIFSVRCANEDAVSAALNSATCPAPTIDGTIRQLASSCQSTSNSHVRLEGVTLTGTQKISFWFNASKTDGSDGIQVDLDASGTKVSVQNPVGTEKASSTSAGFSAQTICVDFHNETNLHTISWQGAECNSEKKGTANVGTVLFNQESAGVYTDGSKGTTMLYRISTGASVSKISTKAAIYEE